MTKAINLDEFLLARVEEAADREDNGTALALLEGVRLVIERYQEVAALADGMDGYTNIVKEKAALRLALADLATAYDDHPDWRPEWRPQT